MMAARGFAGRKQEAPRLVFAARSMPPSWIFIRGRACVLEFGFTVEPYNARG